MGFQRIIMWELPFLGPRVVGVRLVVSMLFPRARRLALGAAVGQAGLLSADVNGRATLDSMSGTA
jgi:hypothetical protein